MSETIPEGNPLKGVGKKVGPLPLYAYALIIVGAAYGVYWWKNRVGVAQPEGVTNVGSGMSSAGPMPGTNDYSGNVSQGEKAAPASQSNAQWARNVTDSLIAAGSSPIDVPTAISNYLSGKTLTPTQQSIISIALQKYGSPPEGIVAPVTKTSGDPNDMVYTVKDGDTLDSIAQRFYGRVNAIDQRLLHINNIDTVSWNETAGYAPLATGTVLRLPVNGIREVQGNTLDRTVS